jgi:hypothetical protein
MATEKQNDALASEPANEATATGRLKLSVKRMKRLRAAVKGGLEIDAPERSTATQPW